MVRHHGSDPASGVRPVRLGLPDLVSESLAGIAARPARLALTTLGTVLGIAALVTTVGLAQTASGQVAQHFDAIAARQVTVELREGQGDSGFGPTVPWDAPARAARLNGVVAAGLFTRLDEPPTGVRTVPVLDPQAASDLQLPLVAASPGLADAVRGKVVTGRFFDEGHDERAERVVVLGQRAAERLRINRVDALPSIFLGDESYTVLGIIDDVVRRTELLDAVIVPNGVARQRLGLEEPSEIHVRTVLGGAGLAARQVPIALDPQHPEAFVATTAPSPSAIRDQVKADVNALFLVLGAVALLIGALGIANITLLSVLERIGEIGLRRALGATRRDIAKLFLLESCTVGLLGGLIGTAVGVLTTLGVSVAREWTPLLDTKLAMAAPLLGAFIGLAAGTYPAWKASAVEPIAALRAE